LPSGHVAERKQDDAQAERDDEDVDHDLDEGEPKLELELADSFTEMRLAVNSASSTTAAVTH
jgi:hypothetical protein